MGVILTHGLITRMVRFHFYSPDKNLIPSLTITMNVTNNKIIIIIIIKGISLLFLQLFSLKYRDAHRHYLQHNPNTPLRLCEEKCEEVSGACCWTRRSVADVECYGRSCSRCDACLDRRSECLGCAVLSS